MTVQIPVNFLNETDSPGLERGGLLNVVRHEIEMICRADAIPPSVNVDLTGLEIGDRVVLHVARQDPLLVPAQPHLVDRGQEGPGVELLVQIARIDRDQGRDGAAK